MKLLAIAFLLLSPAALFAQEPLPDIGSLDAIKGKTKFYVIANTEDREKILKVMTKRPELSAVTSPDDAEFFIEYKALTRDQVGFLTFASGQMDVFVRRDGKKVIAWSDTAKGGAYGSRLAGDATGKFLKALKKGEK